MAELRAVRASRRTAPSGSTRGSDREFHAEIRDLFCAIFHALLLRAAAEGWTESKISSDVQALVREEKVLFLGIPKETKGKVPVRWNPYKLATLGRIVGFGNDTRHYIKPPGLPIQGWHLRRLHLFLEKQIELYYAPQFDIEVRATWVRYLECALELIRSSQTTNLPTPTASSAKPIGLVPRVISADNLSRAYPEGRLSEALSLIRCADDVAALLTRVDHRYEWSLAFRDAFSLLSQDKRQEIAYLFYQAIGGSLWQPPGSALQHVALMAAGTLTYTAMHIEGLREIVIWHDWLESCLDNLDPQLVLIAEPLSYIASIHGHHGAYIKNIRRMIKSDPSYRRADFRERLEYCCSGYAPMDHHQRLLSVARNIADHLHYRKRFPQLISHDVGRVIEVYPSLMRNSQYMDLAQFIKHETLKSLAEIDMNVGERGRVEDLIEGIRR